MRKRSQEFLSRLRRTSYPWLLALLGAAYILASGSELLAAQLGVLAWKLLLVGIGVSVAHAIRVRLFPYIDMSRVLDEDTSTKDGLVFLGLCVLYSAIVLALTQGL